MNVKHDEHGHTRSPHGRDADGNGAHAARSSSSTRRPDGDGTERRGSNTMTSTTAASYPSPADHLGAPAGTNGGPAEGSDEMLLANYRPGDNDSGEFMDLMSSADDTPDEPMQRAELQQSVQRAVASMPEHLREILLLSYFHQFPYKQISDILEIPLGTVKSRLHAAVAHFADRWKSTNHHRTVP